MSLYNQPECFISAEAKLPSLLLTLFMTSAPALAASLLLFILLFGPNPPPSSSSSNSALFFQNQERGNAKERRNAVGRFLSFVMEKEEVSGRGSVDRDSRKLCV